MKVLPVGESINEVIVAEWFKEDGEFVEAEEIICEIESDKASFELPAEASGILKIVAQQEAVLGIGETICFIEPNGEGGTPTDKPAEAVAETPVQEATESKATGEVLEMRVPTVGESINEVTIGEWFKEDGDFVQNEEIICEIESDKATFEFPSEATGKLQIAAQTGDTLAIGDLICKIEVMTGDAPSTSVPSATPAETSAPVSTGGYASGHPAPAASKILAEKGINPADVQGTGVGGRITKEDALKAQKTAPTPPPPAPKAEPTPAPEVATPTSERNVSRKRMTSLRRTIAKRLVSVKNETAMLTTFNEVDMKPVMDMRKQHKEAFKDKHDIGLGFMSFFVKACCIALQEFPSVNAQIDGNQMVYSDFCDVSIAVSTPKGLVVPVIRNAEKLSFAGVEKEIVRLAVKARDGKLSIPEMTGGTFTITNGGIFGSMLSTPIINAPQAAILGMHNIVQRPVVVNGEVVVRPIMYVALSYDHRIIDGRESVSFLVRVKQLLEDPARMMLMV